VAMLGRYDFVPIFLQSFQLPLPVGRK
jgi:hypothetical protein